MNSNCTITSESIHWYNTESFSKENLIPSFSFISVTFTRLTISFCLKKEAVLGSLFFTLKLLFSIFMKSWYAFSRFLLTADNFTVELPMSELDLESSLRITESPETMKQFLSRSRLMHFKFSSNSTILTAHACFDSSGRIFTIPVTCKRFFSQSIMTRGFLVVMLSLSPKFSIFFWCSLDILGGSSSLM